jgi:hypothetical protein
MSGGGRAATVANRYLPRPENAGRSSQSIIIDILVLEMTISFFSP